MCSSSMPRAAHMFGRIGSTLIRPTWRKGRVRSPVVSRSPNAELVVAADRRIERERAADADARALVMRGWARIYSGYPTAATTEEALQFFERALVLDQGSVEAKIGTAAALVGRLNLRWSSSVERDQARAEQLLEEAL